MSAEQMLATMNTMLQQMQTAQQRSDARQEELHSRLVRAEQRAQDAEDKAEKEKKETVQKVSFTIDGKLLDKIVMFDGKKANWPDWTFSFSSTLEMEAIKAMRWACDQEDTIDDQIVANASEKAWITHSRALYRALALKANKGEAATRIRQAGAGNGLEAWKLLIQYYEPRSRGRQRDVFRKLNKPIMDKNKSLLNNIEMWEQYIRDYEKRFSKKG